MTLPHSDNKLEISRNSLVGNSIVNRSTPPDGSEIIFHALIATRQTKNQRKLCLEMLIESLMFNVMLNNF